MSGIFCVGVVIAYCFIPAPQPVDSFCLAYHKVIVEKGDANIVAPVGVKRRLLANELLYKQCKGAK